MKIKFKFENKIYTANLGDSIASALIANKVFELNNSSSKRGVFCGMGVCHECLVQVNGENNVRACLRKLEKDSYILKQKQVEVSDFMNDKTYSEVKHEEYFPDLLVIGGGVGGLCAASNASKCGVKTILIDDREKLGGQFCKQPLTNEKAKFDDQVILGKKLIYEVDKNGVKIFKNTSVFAIFKNKEILAIKENSLITFKPKKIIFATGAYERGYPVTGWTLPGVMTTGAMQNLLKAYNVLAGKKILMCGNGPFVLHVARELKKAGAKIVAITERSKKPSISNYKIFYNLLSNSMKLFFKGIRYTLFLKFNRIPLFHEYIISKIEEKDNGLVGVIKKLDGSRSKSFEVDCICLGYGFNSSNNILRYLNCEHVYNYDSNSLVTLRKNDFQTSVNDIYAIGDCVKINGAQVAEIEGHLCGYNVADSLGYKIDPEFGEDKKTLEIKLKKLEKFQLNLWKLYNSNSDHSIFLEKDVEICRCEGIKFSTLEHVLENGYTSISELKLKSRIGMGPCQGRYCGQIVLDILKNNFGIKVKETDFVTPRVPFMPINIENFLNHITNGRK